MRARRFQTNFTGGEISGRAFARTDINRYANSAARIENMIVGTRGEVFRRTGTYFAGHTKNTTGAVKLVRFEVSTIAAYILEFGEEYVRFWRNRAQIESGGSPYEIATPYQDGDIGRLRFAQSADVLYICHPDYAPRKLVRTGADTFSLSVVDFQDGPYQDENTTAITLTPSDTATGTTITVTASAALFTSDDVGRLLSISDEPTTREPATAFTTDNIVQSYYAGVTRLYRCVVAGTTAAADPTTGLEPPYDKGAPRDESDAVRDGTVVWRYFWRGQSVAGWGVITAVGSSTSATVQLRVPLAATTASVRWRLGEWGGSRGWPSAMTFHAGRTVWAGSTARPQTVWMSETGDFESMSPTEPDGAVLDTNAITVTLDDDQVNSIRWLSSLNGNLFLGAPSGEFAISATNRGGALSPSNIRAERKGDRGSSDIVPGVRAGNALLFVSKDGKQLRQLVYDFSTDSFNAADLTVLAEHISDTAIVDIARQTSPLGIVWAVTEGGWLLSLTYDQDEEVRAWSRHLRAGDVNAGA